MFTATASHKDVTGQTRIENAYVLNQLHQLLTHEEAAMTAASQPVLKMAHAYRVNSHDAQFWFDQVLRLEGIQSLSEQITVILADFPQFAEKATARRLRYSERVSSAIKTAIRPYQQARQGYARVK